MIIDLSSKRGVVITLDTEEDQGGMLALAQIALQCKNGSSEDYPSYDDDARRIAELILEAME